MNKRNKRMSIFEMKWHQFLRMPNQLSSCKFPHLTLIFFPIKIKIWYYWVQVQELDPVERIDILHTLFTTTVNRFISKEKNWKKKTHIEAMVYTLTSTSNKSNSTKWMYIPQLIKKRKCMTRINFTNHQFNHVIAINNESGKLSNTGTINK